MNSMSEWREYIISDLGKIITGKTPRTAIPDNYGGDIPFLSPSDDMDSKYMPSTARSLTEKGLSEVKNCLIPKNSICVSCIGSDMGKSVITDRPIITNQQINSIIPSESFDPHFVYYLMQGKRREIRFIGRNGTAVPILNKSAFSNLTIMAPEIDEQRRIASILSYLDDKIAVNRRICENLEAQAQALFKHWFVDFAPFKDAKFVESELGLIPEGWRVGTLGDIAELRKTTIKPQDNILYTHYSIPAFDNGKKPSIDEGSTIKSNKFGISDSAVLLSKLNPSTKRIWYTGNVPDNSVSSTEFLPFYSKNKELTPFVYCYLNCDRNYREIANGAKGTTNSHQRIDANSILTRGLAYSEEAIKKFCDCCQYLMELILEANQESSRLATLRDTLLPKLMSGEIKVGDVK
jgi:type I restriction enzyme S subunit